MKLIIFRYFEEFEGNHSSVSFRLWRIKQHFFYNLSVGSGCKGKCQITYDTELHH